MFDRCYKKFYEIVWIDWSWSYNYDKVKSKQKVELKLEHNKLYKNDN